VTGLPVYLPEDEVADFFTKYGSIKKVSLQVNPKTKNSLGIAVIHFDGSASAASSAALKALKKENGSSIGGSVVKVEFDDDQGSL
jgi:RNA recognition motif-containing protein